METEKMIPKTTKQNSPIENDVSCLRCRHYLGGGCCRINLEGECREGGGFELWEPIPNSSERNDFHESD